MRLRALLVPLVLALTAPVGAAVAQTADVFDGDPATTARVDLGEPVAAAVALSQLRFPAGEQVSTAVVARADAFADALAAAPLIVDAPLLYTSTAALPDEVAAELDRVLSADAIVYVLGGVAAVSAEVATQLEGLSRDVIRLAGDDRIATAIEVARTVVSSNHDTGTGQPGTVALARAFGEGSAAWADSVTGGAWAAAAGVPVLVTTTEALDPRVAAAMTELGVTRTVVLGGTAALSAAVEEAVPGAQRVAGDERAATAAAIAAQLWPAGERRLVFNGYRDDGWTIGLAAAGLAADTGAPLLPVDTTTVPAAALAQLGQGCGTDTATVDTVLLGDAVRLGPEIPAIIDAQDGGVCPLEPGTPAAVMDRVTTEIRADVIADGTPIGEDFTITCQVPPAIALGAETSCILTPDDPMFEGAQAAVVFIDTDGHYNYTYGTGFILTGAEMVQEYGSGLFCRDLNELGEPFFGAIQYWFAEGRPDRMDADLNGVPCETVYPAEQIASWYDPADRRGGY